MTTMPSDDLKIERLHMEDGSIGFIAWGVHNPHEFLDVLAERGYGHLDFDDVRHVRFVETEEVPEGFTAWYKPVQGEPNCTLITV